MTWSSEPAYLILRIILTQKIIAHEKSEYVYTYEIFNIKSYQSLWIYCIVSKMGQNIRIKINLY